MEKVKGLPYGVARFEEVRNENFYYVDKTMYLPLLEATSKYLFLIRPRRFGKSMFVSMMEAYYDIAPTIVKRIDRQEDRDAVYRNLYEEYLLPCIRKIEAQDYEACKVRYQEMVMELKARYIH